MRNQSTIRCYNSKGYVSTVLRGALSSSTSRRSASDPVLAKAATLSESPQRPSAAPPRQHPAWPGAELQHTRHTTVDGHPPQPSSTHNKEFSRCPCRTNSSSKLQLCRILKWGQQSVRFRVLTGPPSDTEASDRDPHPPHSLPPSPPRRHQCTKHPQDLEWRLGALCLGRGLDSAPAVGVGVCEQHSRGCSYESGFRL